MGVARQLYELQEIDQAIDAEERALQQRLDQLGESPALVSARDTLTTEQRQLDGLRHEQRSVEMDMDDLTSKITVIDEKLYSGRIRNPKELSDLQHEGNTLKAKRDQLESRALEIMERVDQTQASAAAASRDFQRTESEWRGQQQRLAAEIEEVRARLAEFNDSRRLAVNGADPWLIELYAKLRKQKGQALAKIEQGICRGCRISLSSNEIQQARSGNLVQCSSCGRILYLP